MLSINDLKDTILAEGVATLGYVWISKGFKAHDTVSILAHYIIYAYFHSLVILRRLSILQTAHWLD